MYKRACLCGSVRAGLQKQISEAPETSNQLKHVNMFVLIVVPLKPFFGEVA